MVVCKFFQQGSCRYGQNCRFEHVYGSKYSYNSNAPPQAAPAAPAVTDEQLINQVHSDVQAVIRGGQWILSSYAPFKEKAAFPGIVDLSPEEARLFIYEAKASGNVEQAVAYINELFKEARTKYEQLLLKNTNITRVFRSLYKGEHVASPFGNVSQENPALGNDNPASSVFRSAIQTSTFAQNNQTPTFAQNNQTPTFAQNNQTPTFAQNNQTPSIFSQNNTPSVFAQNNANPSIFNQNNTVTNSDPAKSIFAQANQTPFNTNQSPFAAQTTNNMNFENSQAPNVFGPQTDSAKSIFAQATQNVFPSPPQNVAQSDPSNLFANASQSVFAQNQQTPFSQSPNNLFQKPEAENVFRLNQNVFQQTNAGDTSYYSKMEDLSADDVEAFKSDDFKMGLIPELPPPHSLCF